MMIDLRESQILKGQMPQTGDGVIRREFPAPHVVKQFSDGFRVQAATRDTASPRPEV
jgi:hypothetical protein